jgi:putative ABC transport system substrate-binding protein
MAIHLAVVVGLVMIGAAASAAQKTACDLRRAPDHKDIVMLLWRGASEVEAGFRAYVVENDLPFNVTCLSAGMDPDALPRIIDRAKQMQPDLIYTWGTPTTRATLGTHEDAAPNRRVREIPVIFTMVAYPVKSGIVPSFNAARPNATGATHSVPVEAQVRAMKSYRPLKRLGVIYNPLENNSVVNVRQLKGLAREGDFEVIALPVELDSENRPDPESLPKLVDKLAAREPQFLYLGPDSFIGSHRETVTREAMAHGIPAFTATQLTIQKGEALLGLYTSYFNLGRYMAYLAERVLINEVDPGRIPVQRLTRFTYGLRLSVADRLGVYPPLDVLDYAKVLDRAE